MSMRCNSTINLQTMWREAKSVAVLSRALPSNLRPNLFSGD
jgi:hypothetical protein